MEKTLEQKVAECILQQTSETIEVDGRVYELAPPTPATLIMISSLISQFPVVNGNTENVIYEVLSTAKDLSILGKICAVFIIGAKRAREKKKIYKTKIEYYEKWSWRKFRKVVETRNVGYYIDEVDWLADKLLHEVTNETLTRIVAKRLGSMQITDFFALTTSLSDANQLKRTREVEATVSGGE